MPAQWRLLAEKIIRHRAGSSRDTRVPLSLGNQSQPCTQAELPPAQLEMTAVSLHLGRGGGVVSPGPALSGTCCLTDTRANSCVLPMDLNQHPQLSPGKKILHHSPVEEAEFWALEPETGGDWEDVVKGHRDLFTPSLSRSGKGVQGPAG